MKQVERHAPLLAGLLIAAPTLISYYPPMSDLPMHEGVIGVLRHFGDKSYFPEDIYRLNLGHPNQLFHYVSWALSWVFGTRWAVKLVVAASQIAIFHSGARLADYLGRSRWGALLLAPLALGFTYYWGLVANMLGFAMLLYVLPPLDRMVAEPTPKAIARICGVSALLYLAHESTLLMGLGALALFTLARPLEKRLTLLRLVPIGFAALLGLAHYVYQTRTSPETFTMGLPSSWFSLFEKLKFFANALVGSYDWEVQFLLFGLGVIGCVALAVGRRQDPALDPPTESGIRRFRAFVHRYRFEAYALACVLLYFVSPYNWKGITLLHERFLGPGWAVLVIVAAPKGEPSKLARFAGAVFPLAIVLVAWPQFAEANLSYRRLDRLMDQIPRGSTVAECVLDQREPFARTFSVGPGTARSLAVVGGRSSLALVGSPISPVRMKQEYAWSDFDLRMFIYGSRSFMPTFDFARWHYLLAQSRTPRLRQQLREAFAPDADLVSEEGEWMLFRAKHPKLPMTAKNERPPQSALDDSILHRVLKIDTRMRAEEAADAGVAPPPGAGPDALGPAPTIDAGLAAPGDAGAP